MALHDDEAKLDTLAKLARSRAEIRRVLEPAPRLGPGAKASGHTDNDAAYPEDPHDGVFPRSRTMRLLLSGRGIGTIGAVLGGLVIARPALALKLLRVLPTGAVARMLMVKAVGAFRSRS